MMTLRDIPADRPVLIAGPTASGKSELALRIAETQGGTIINADASQVYGCWQIVTARPDPAEEARAPHRLYGHVGWQQDYSAGHWLREVTSLLGTGPRPIIVGGTGLYFMALTEGMAEIPATPPEVRTAADALPLDALLAGLDPVTTARIDTRNRARVQRAWEVQRSTGRALAAWQDDTPPPTLPPEDVTRIVFDAPKDWLDPRIRLRIDRMIDTGAVDEVRRMLDHYDPALPAFRAIGVPEIADHLTNGTALAETREHMAIATRQYAKRQRTWFRRRMQDWTWIRGDHFA